MASHRDHKMMDDDEAVHETKSHAPLQVSAASAFGTSSGGSGVGTGSGSGSAGSDSGSAQQLQMELVLDALPYIDFEYTDPTLKPRVDELVREEAMRSHFKPADYLAAKEHLKLPEFKIMGSAFWEAECARLAGGGGTSNPPMDVTRYKCEAPKLAFLIDSKTGKAKSESALTADERLQAIRAWTDAVLNAQTQLSHQTERLLNLELLKKFGGTAWKSHNEHLHSLQQSMDNAVLASKKSIEAVNRKRKTEQIAAAPTLHGLETAWYQLIQKNHEIEVACSVLDADIKRLKTDALNRGLIKSTSANGTAPTALATAAKK